MIKETSSQTDLPTSSKSKGVLYFGWGYNRDWYTKSNIRFWNNKPQLINGEYYEYDFTIYKVKAEDRPQFDRIYDVVNITIPQFGFRLGYIFKRFNGLGIELNYDHTKYVVNDYQKVRIKGHINGNYFDKDTILDPKKFLHFEHTDGANFWMINLVKHKTLIKAKNNKCNLVFTFKPGVGVVIPRTDVTLFGQRLNNAWKVAGFDVGIESGLRLELYEHIYMEITGKGVYANYLNAFVLGKGNGKARHQFGAFEVIATVGCQLKKR